MAFHVRKVVAGKSEHVARKNAGPIGSRKVMCQQECCDSARGEREDYQNVVHLDWRQEMQQRNGQKSIEDIQGVREKRNTKRIIQIGRMPGGLVEVRNSFVNPPQVPIEDHTIPRIREKMSGESAD